MAGHRIAYALQREADVTLIDPKDFFEVPMAVPRMLVEPDRARDAIIPYTEFLPNVARAEIEQCGHLPHFTHPELLTEVIRQFLAK